MIKEILEDTESRMADTVEHLKREKGESSLLPFSLSWSNAGYAAMTRARSLVEVLRRRPEAFGSKGGCEMEESLNRLSRDLEELLMV